MSIQFNNAFFDGLSRSPAVVSICLAKGNAGAAAMRAAAPEDSGDYKRAFRVRVKYQRRAVVVIENTDPKALLIESKLGVMARATKALRRG